MFKARTVKTRSVYCLNNNTNKGKYMNKITKILVVVASSLAISFAAVAGELSVTGSAKASYVFSGGNNDDKGLGVGNPEYDMHLL